MKALIVLEYLPDLIKHYDYLIGVEKGALALAKAGIHMDAVIGDMDSLSASQVKLVLAHCDSHIRLQVEKDESDSQAAYKLAKQQGADEVIIIGGLGKRADHSWVNLMMVYDYADITLMDGQNTIRVLLPGEQVIDSGPRQYYSFFAPESCVLSLTGGFHYHLKQRHLQLYDLYTLSNQIDSFPGHILVQEGKCLMFISRDLPKKKG
ncbi:MAG: thiamine diphosphokinase [Erysipelotrichaceae bacterium]|jgi:thiamine pyrophosphokinase|nr:thiamine diphosphokinase [Erysipelotrichaceae bacterium]